MVVHGSQDDTSLDPGWCPECGELAAVCESDGVCPLGVEAKRVRELDGSNDERWNRLVYEFGQFINRLMHRGSLGIWQFCEFVMPLRDRLESGERTEQLFSAISATIKDLDLQ